MDDCSPDFRLALTSNQEAQMETTPPAQDAKGSSQSPSLTLGSFPILWRCRGRLVGVGNSRTLALLPAQLPDCYLVLSDQNYQRLPSPRTRLFWVPCLPGRWDCEPTEISCSLGYSYQIFVTEMRKVIQTELDNRKMRQTQNSTTYCTDQLISSTSKTQD